MKTAGLTAAVVAAWVATIFAWPFAFLALALSWALMAKIGLGKFFELIGAAIVLCVIFVGAWGSTYVTLPEAEPGWKAEQQFETVLVFGFFTLMGGAALAVAMVARGLKKIFPEPTAEEWLQMNGLPTRFEVTAVGANWIEFVHPEGGAWAYGITQDLACVHGISLIEGLGGWKYRMWTDRNPKNAKTVLEAAYRFRTEPKVIHDGVVVLYKCPGYEILFQEAERNLD